MEEILQQILDIWIDGGWLMIPLAALTAFIYASISELLVYLWKNDLTQVNENIWRAWVDQPENAKGPVGEIIHYCLGDLEREPKPLDAFRFRIGEVVSAHLPRIDSRITYAKVLIGTAPLTGLLGTVIGMLSTFRGLSVSGAGNTIDLVAGGISQALITTQTGLVIAIPAYVILSVVTRMRQKQAVFLSKLETELFRKLQKEFPAAAA